MLKYIINTQVSQQQKNVFMRINDLQNITVI